MTNLPTCIRTFRWCRAVCSIFFFSLSFSIKVLNASRLSIFSSQIVDSSCTHKFKTTTITFPPVPGAFHVFPNVFSTASPPAYDTRYLLHPHYFRCPLRYWLLFKQGQSSSMTTCSLQCRILRCHMLGPPLWMFLESRWSCSERYWRRTKTPSRLSLQAAELWDGTWWRATYARTVIILWFFTLGSTIFPLLPFTEF